MTVAEDAITTEEVQVVVSAVKEKVLVAEEVLAVAVSAAIEVQHLEAVVLDQEKKVVFLTEHLVKAGSEEEANREVHQLLKEKVVFHQNAHQEDPMLQDRADFQKDLQDVRKVPQIHLEKEDQEKANTFC